MRASTERKSYHKEVVFGCALICGGSLNPNFTTKSRIILLDSFLLCRLLHLKLWS